MIGHSLKLPKINGELHEINTKKSLVFIGANGSGKTRLGTWIEINGPQKEKVHRISAQKSLAMPDSTTPVAIELAECDLLFGHSKDQNNKSGHKYQGRPAIAPINDFEKLIRYLFSDETESNALFKAMCRENPNAEIPETKLDKVKQVWEIILPHRELIIRGLRIQTGVKGKPERIYNSSEMSDGERVVFYLIAQCLSAPKDGIIIVDEPELHLHKSVQYLLWSEVERLRSDCLFIYLTHDIDFAASQEGAERIWLKGFDGQNWDWEIIYPDNELPQDLLLQVLGNRRPVIFVEGDNGSYDVSLYRSILKDFLVIPRGSCTNVIQTVKAFQANSQFHNLSVCGIVDRDRRVSAEIESLADQNVFVLSLAEVENLFCTKNVIEIVSKHLLRDSDADFSAVVNHVFSRFESELENQVSMRVAGEIKFRLSRFEEKNIEEVAMKSAVQRLFEGIDVSEIYAEVRSHFEAVIASRDYCSLLEVYNRKSLPSQISQFFGLKNGELAEFVVRLAHRGKHVELGNAIRPYFGRFADKFFN
jgi:energy-coupling factor transporter ATP-binding protein EcfA2